MTLVRFFVFASTTFAPSSSLISKFCSGTFSYSNSSSLLLASSDGCEAGGDGDPGADCDRGADGDGDTGEDDDDEDDDDDSSCNSGPVSSCSFSTRAVALFNLSISSFFLP